MVDVAGLLSGGLVLSNQVLAATIVLTSFSLLIYLLTHNFRSEVARAFCAILAFVLIVYAGDVVLYEVETQQVAIRWLKFQWIGIAFMPAAYLQFSDALLRTTNLRSRWRSIAVLASYGASIFFLGLVFLGDALVHDGIFEPNTYHLSAGPLFWLFALYFGITVAGGAINIQRARQRCLTRASRRRMTYLGMAFLAPALGVFPYLVLAGLSSPLPPYLLQILLLLGNVGVLLMIMLMAYSVAYFGALTPDRVIRHNLVHYLLRGPVVGAVVIFTMLAVPKVQMIFGLPRDTVLIFAVVGVIVLLQLLINRAKPFIDRLIYRQDREELAWIQTLDRRLLTTADLQAFLEGILATLCDLLQVGTGFVAVHAGGQHRLEAHCGEQGTVQQFLESKDLNVLVNSIINQEDACRFSPGNGFWLVPLSSQSGDVRLGVLGVEARASIPDLDKSEKEIAALLIGRVQEALEDRYLQQNVFDTLRRILPDIERIHRLQDATQYPGPPMEALEDSLIHSPHFSQWVKDALSHYWGGPKLTESPLMALNIVRQQIEVQGGNPANALRTVLNEAIERLRPEGERQMATNEWILYNILELKFLRGLKVRDIAGRLAMSESDLYRKQRIAIEQVAGELADLERNGDSPAKHAGQQVVETGVATGNYLDNHS